jgi:hypothetical protein
LPSATDQQYPKTETKNSGCKLGEQHLNNSLHSRLLWILEPCLRLWVLPVSSNFCALKKFRMTVCDSHLTSRTPFCVFQWQTNHIFSLFSRLADASHRNHAEQVFDQIRESDPATFFVELSKELRNDHQEDRIRQQAGLLMKVSLDAAVSHR